MYIASDGGFGSETQLRALPGGSLGEQERRRGQRKRKAERRGVGRRCRDVG